MKVLITVLDWGLGHATRCIPVIRELLLRGCIVSVAGNGDSLTLLKNEFPALAYFDLPGYDPVYPSRGRMAIRMAFQLPKFFKVIRKEHRVIESLVQTENFDLIISDNRYGCWSEHIPGIFITHQLNIQLPENFSWLSKAVNRLQSKLINKFSTCWIPDFPDTETNLSGDLSKVDKAVLSRVVHVGPLSRFKAVYEERIEYDIVCILSGPEPQRSIFEEKVLSQLKKSALRYLVVRGVFKKMQEVMPNTVASLNSHDLQDVISRSLVVIARSGYSTIMDLVAMRKKAVVIPTPGQTEQEYLAKRLSERGIFKSMSQEDFNLETAMHALGHFTGFNKTTETSSDLLRNELDRLITVKTLSTSFSK